MIQPNELRIGNIYNRKHGKGWTETVITSEIIGKLFGSDLEYALDDFEPITLESNWMFDFGFENFHTNPRLESFWYNNQGYYPVMVQQSRDCRFYFQENTLLSHVHQLQNLYFALTGEELTIKQTV